MSEDERPTAQAAPPTPTTPVRPAGPLKPGVVGKPANRPNVVPRGLPIRSNQTTPTAQQGVRCLYIGLPVTGKTTKMLTWPGVVFVQFDEESSVVYGSKRPVPVIQVGDWSTWTDVILPAIKAGKIQAAVNEMEGFEDYKVEAIAIDSWTGLGEMCETYCRSLESNTMRMYGEKLLKLRQTKDDLFSITRPTANRPALNLIGAVHERALTRSVKDAATNQFKEITESIVPSITGSFGEKFFEYWSVILWCFYEIEHDRDGNLIKGKPPLYYCRTDPIDQWRRGVDRLGGGRLPRLPARVSGSYADLAKCWGINQLPVDRKEP